MNGDGFDGKDFDPVDYIKSFSEGANLTIDPFIGPLWTHLFGGAFRGELQHMVIIRLVWVYGTLNSSEIVGIGRLDACQR